MGFRSPQAPGRLVDVGGHRLHIDCAGQGPVTVVFDAALGGSSLSWWYVKPEVARSARACAFDRAGFGWSDAGPMPRTAGRISSELRTLLDRAEVPPPYLLVGHSFGALSLRLFAARHRQDVAGLVLVEPAFPEDWVAPGEHERRRVELGMRLCRYGAFASRTGLSRIVGLLVAAGALRAARRIAALASRLELRPEHEEILAPIWRLPPDARAKLRRMWTQRKFYDALGSQIASIGESAAEVLRDGAIDGLPLVVVSATSPHPHHVMMQERLLGASPRSRRIVAAAAGHWVPLDEPAAVVTGIRMLLPGGELYR